MANQENTTSLGINGNARRIVGLSWFPVPGKVQQARQNLERTEALVQAVEMPVIASGGISQIADIKKLAEIGVEAAIIGRSLYEGTLNLSDAINAAK